MLVLAAAPPHYPLFLPISLNSLDREGVRLLSPCDSHITYKTRCRDRWYRSRRFDWAQVGGRWGLRTILRFLSRRSVVEPSWGDRGPYAFGVDLYFGTAVGPWVYWMNVMLFMYLCDVASVSQLCIFSPFIYITWVVCEDYLTCDIVFNAVMPLSRASTRRRYSRI